MSDGIVILGTVALVGLVAIMTVALVYDRRLWVRGSDSQLELKAGDSGKSEEVVDATASTTR
jgi:hypothetical protein